MSEIKHTPGPWTATAFGDVTPVGANHLVASCGGKSGLYRNWKADSRLIAAAPELLEAMSKRVSDAEQRVFEEWLRHTAPSGDVERVQDQWEHSSEFSDFCEEWASERAAIAKAAGA